MYVDTCNIVEILSEFLLKIRYIYSDVQTNTSEFLKKTIHNSDKSVIAANTKPTSCLPAG